MDWISGLQRAVDYIEAHLDEPLDYADIAAQSYSSSYHFQRVFSLLCGMTLGEYIRCRRLALAGAELSAGGAKVIDVALKYGYDSPDSFARAFAKFHGITPSGARQGQQIRSFSRFTVKLVLEGGTKMMYRIETKPELILTGYRRRFTGLPFGPDRERQEEDFFCTTRAAQWLLRGAAAANHIDYCVVDNIADDGYDFFIAAALDADERAYMLDSAVMGVDMTQFRFEHITIPAQTYAVFATEHSEAPIDEYLDIRQRIAAEWLPGSGYTLANAPELALYHWRPQTGKHDRYIEICLPVEPAKPDNPPAESH